MVVVTAAALNVAAVVVAVVVVNVVAVDISHFPVNEDLENGRERRKKELFNGRSLLLQLNFGVPLLSVDHCSWHQRVLLHCPGESILK